MPAVVHVTDPGDPTESDATYAGPLAPRNATRPTMSRQQVRPAARTVSFSWAALPDRDVVAVHVTMHPGSVAPANPNAGTHRVTALGPRRSTSISRLTPNTRYAYSVWAEDASGNLSARRTGIVLTARR